MSQVKDRTAPAGELTVQREPTLADLRRENESFRDDVSLLRDKFAQQQHHVKMLEAEKARLAQQLARQRSRNAALLKSTSWRMTWPLRKVVDTCRAFGRAVLEPRRGVSDPPQTLPRASIDAQAFFRDGFIAPIDLFTPAQCKLIARHYELRATRSPAEVPKELAANDRLFHDIATRPGLLALLRPLLGDDIVLWGASVIERVPGQVHPWHTDIESSAADARCVTVWVGLENTCKDTSLQLVSRSHKFGKPIQQVANEHGLRRRQLTDELVAAWARERDAAADIVQPEVSNGQAIVFDGRLWHASHNTGEKPRAALLLQYAAVGTPVLNPDYSQLEWPFRIVSTSPPSILVSGEGNAGAAPPLRAPWSTTNLPLTTHVHGGGGFVEAGEGWKPYGLFSAPTPIIDGIMGAHVSVLSSGHCPHPPHCHVEEELLIVLDGEAEILVASSTDPESAEVKRFTPGSFIYYPAYQHHTLRNASSSPVTYLMFKWQGAPLEVANPLPTTIAVIGGISADPSSKPMKTRVLFEAPTAYLGKLHAHVTELQPGGGYAAHADPYDVAIVVFSGTVETLGKTVGPHGSIYYAAGELHGMRNVGDEPAKYLVFEFHGPSAVTQ